MNRFTRQPRSYLTPFFTFYGETVILSDGSQTRGILNWIDETKPDNSAVVISRTPILSVIEGTPIKSHDIIRISDRSYRVTAPPLVSSGGMSEYVLSVAKVD